MISQNQFQLKTLKQLLPLLHNVLQSKMLLFMIYVITNRKVINDIYETTTSLHSDDPSYARLSNPQVLGNMLLVFTDAQNKVRKGHKRQ